MIYPKLLKLCLAGSSRKKYDLSLQSQLLFNVSQQPAVDEVSNIIFSRSSISILVVLNLRKNNSSQELLIFDSHEITVVIVMINHISYGLNLPNIVSITWGMSSSGLEDVRRVSRQKSDVLSFYAVFCRAVLVLESSRDSTSTLTYFSQNSEKTGNFFVHKRTKQTLQTVIDWV